MQSVIDTSADAPGKGTRLKPFNFPRKKLIGGGSNDHDPNYTVEQMKAVVIGR